MQPINRYRITIALFLGVLGYVPLWGQNIDFAPDRPDGPAKIQSTLWELAIQGAAKPTRDLQDTVVVILVPQLEQASASIDTSLLAELGGRVLAQSKSLMRVAVPPSSLVAVSELPGVRFVRRPHRPHFQATISEGASRIGALANHSAGVKGQGVKVAIIDVGFKGANELSGDMPARWNYYDYTGEGIYAGDSVHGTACAEIIHDVAPEAELTLLKVGNLLDLENAKDLCIQERIDIINHSAGWFGTGIGDGRGEACDIVNDATDKGILWVNSAGNDAQSHYYGFWSDSDDDGWQNFSGDDEVLAFKAEEGEEIRIFLTWNDWPSSRQNYDLYLSFTNSSGDLEFADESTDRQDIFGGDPVESIEYDVERSGKYGIIVRSEDARPRRLKIWSLNHDFEEFAIAENSIGSPADARGSMSVGAIYHRNWNAGRIDDYSSRGPTTDGRIKPELVAPTGVSTVSHAPYIFDGTSFAAPHVAGAAALIKSANPSYSRTQLWNALVAATVDIGIRGRDNDSGYGKLVLPIMRVSANTSPRISSVSPQTGRTNTVVTISGSNFGSSRGSSSVRIGSVVIPSSAFTSWSSSRIRFRIPVNTPPGNLTVRTSQGTSNPVRLQITSPYLTGISPTRAQTGDRLTLTGGNFGNRRGSGYVLFASNVRPSAADYVSWSNSRIVVKVPARARSGNVQVTTSNGTSGTKRLVIESAAPRITSVSPSRVQYNQVVTVTGSNFGSSRGSSTVRIGSIAISSSALTSWSNTRIRFRVPTNVRSGSVTVRTSAGTSNAIRLEITSPYLASVSPSRVKPGDRLTLTGANFRSSRGSSYVLFAPNVWSTASSDYVVWSDSRIVVKVPAGAQSGDVRVVTVGGSSGTKRIVVESVSPRISSVSPSQVQYDQVVTVTGSNFGSSRGSSTVRIGSIAIPSASLAGWSNTRIRFRVPTNVRSGSVTVRTSAGTSNAIRLEITSPYLGNVSPVSVRPGDRLTLTGANFRSTRWSGYVLFTPNVRPASSDYVSWSDSRIVVKVPAGARSGDVKVVAIGALSSGTKRIVVESASPPRITSVSPRQVQHNQVVTVTGSNFGSSRGSSTVRIGSVAIPSSSLASWSSTRIRFRVPTNMHSGNVTVRTSAGTSNAIRLEITSGPYLSSVSPTRVNLGGLLTLTGANFGSRRGSGYVLFTPNVWPTASSDYVTWSDSRIVVRVPAGARSGDVKVVTGGGSSGTKRIVVESASPPRITSVSPRQVQYSQVVTITGSNFGSSRGSSTVRIGSIAIPSSALAGWSNTIIRFRVPTNVRSGNVTVRTSEGTSNAIRLGIISPYLSSVSPSRVKPGDRLTLTGANFRSSRRSGYVLFAPNVRPSSSDYVVWSDSRIVVKVPAGARSGDVKVVTGDGTSGTKRIVVESVGLQITSVSPIQVQYNQVVTITGSNFGSSRGSSTVRIGSIAIPSSALAGWSNTIIRFRVPTNVRSGNVTVRTSAGTSNAIRLEITSPYLGNVSPVSVRPRDRLTLTGANFRSTRGSGYVLFTPNIRPASSDYVSWSDSRIVVRVPAGAQSGEVKVVATGSQVSGIKHIVVEGEVVESLPSSGLFGYSPPTVTKNPKSAKFSFRGTSGELACYFSVKEASDGEIDVFLNGQYYAYIPASEDWTEWYVILDRADLHSGTNIIEFRNAFNQNRTSNFDRWQLKAVWVAAPPSAKPVAGTRILAKVPDSVGSGLGDPFPTPFNAEVTIPFALADAGPVRLVIYNLMGQPIRVLADSWLAAGAHRVSWNGRTAAGVEAASGVYWAVLQAGGAVQTAKLALIR